MYLLKIFKMYVFKFSTPDIFTRTLRFSASTLIYFTPSTNFFADKFKLFLVFLVISSKQHRFDFLKFNCIIIFVYCASSSVSDWSLYGVTGIKLKRETQTGIHSHAYEWKVAIKYSLKIIFFSESLEGNCTSSEKINRIVRGWTVSSAGDRCEWIKVKGVIVQYKY